MKPLVWGAVAVVTALVALLVHIFIRALRSAEVAEAERVLREHDR